MCEGYSSTSRTIWSSKSVGHGFAMNLAFAGTPAGDGKWRPEMRTNAVLGHLLSTTHARSSPVIVPGISMSLTTAAVQ